MIVTRDVLDGFLAELSGSRASTLPRRPNSHGLFGPGSPMWTVNRESILFLGGGRAALLQLAHPYVAQGVAHHSLAEGDLAGRFQRTFDLVYTLVFGPTDEAMRVARRIHHLHTRVEGPLEAGAGPFPAGHRYAANEEAALLWVFATLTETAVRIYEDMVHPMSPQARASYYEDARRFARLFGISDAALPPTWPDFVAYFEGMLASETLTVSACARDLGRFLLTPPRRTVIPLWRGYEAVTAALLPRRLQRAFGLRFGPIERPVARAAIASLRASYHRLPRRLRWMPAYRDARRRLAGVEDRDPFGVLGEKLVLSGLRPNRAAR